jgi:hypothetical protein
MQGVCPSQKYQPTLQHPTALLDGPGLWGDASVRSPGMTRWVLFKGT